MSDPLQTVLTAARATEDTRGNAAFQHVSGVAELPGEGNYPAFLITLIDAVSSSTSANVGARSPELIDQSTAVQGIIYHDVETIKDLSTETKTQWTWADVRTLFEGFLYELWREDPVDPDTGTQRRQARAPNANLERAQRSTRTVEGKMRYAVGFELDMDGSLSPGSLQGGYSSP